ncbi:methionine-S-sulfoxide reductase [Azospira oryzae PS]|uniref:Peptide methionine sulfoxide reductase MsrA n=2 Tax=Azospira oryzae TaxID=146939 RepID=G8QMV1_AZOOP|nr:methionine-S-sulfoxide reductase [Azospira oryzae PS]
MWLGCFHLYLTKFPPTQKRPPGDLNCRKGSIRSEFIYLLMVHFHPLAMETNMTLGNVEVDHLTLGGGCFWCLEAVFRRLDGVLSVEPGYSGGRTEAPDYEAVCTGTTGHAEVVRITFDPVRIGFQALLQVFFSSHDPTTVNRQGHDIGSQYRSVIFFASPLQEALAKQFIADLQAQWPSPIVTELLPLGPFHQAEAYHRDYYARNSDHPYCQLVIAPKLQQLKRDFPDRLSAV